MTEHLPECWAKHPSDPPAWCICDELHACEERVSGEFLTSAALAVTGMNDPRYAKGYTDAGEAGYLRGLDAAREAVAALDAFYAIEECQGNPLRKGDPEVPDPWHQGHLIERDDALAAIDALKEES